ncbi:MAG: sigma-70 family RNA polymerase sigma factor [Betaproteobacteria bacterium]|nr:sigma-70 family RNA polymerase sigma factor [Betaproteobacteria bacterium]
MSVNKPSALMEGDTLTELRRDLLRFAQLQLRDEQMAEDVVQDALMAALAGEKKFAGRSALKTWVYAILRNKIIDAIRLRAKSINVSALSTEEEGLDQAFDALFAANEHWQQSGKPVAWKNPEDALQQQQFWVVFNACLNHLPDNTARVFMMREHLGMDTTEICETLQISESNCYVILHRARNSLRDCLSRGWFSEGEAPC